MAEKVETIKTKRFVVRQSLIGKKQVIEFINKKGDLVIYDHDKAFELMKDKLETLPCWEKYKSYTATTNIPTVLRGSKAVLSSVKIKA
mgnify:CR=1 FL=1